MSEFFLVAQLDSENYRYLNLTLQVSASPREASCSQDKLIVDEIVVDCLAGLCELCCVRESKVVVVGCL